VCFSSDGQQLATGSDDGTVRVWDARHGQEPVRLTGHSARAQRILFSSDGQRMATLTPGDDHYFEEVKVWDVRTGQELLSFSESDTRVSSIAFSPNGRRLATVDRNFQLKLWSLPGGRKECTRNGYFSVCFHPDGKRLAACGVDGVVRLL